MSCKPILPPTDTEGKEAFGGQYASPPLPDEFISIEREIPETLGDFYDKAMKAYEIVKNAHVQAILGGDKEAAAELAKELRGAEHRWAVVKERMARDVALSHRCVGFTGRNIGEVIKPFLVHFVPLVLEELSPQHLAELLLNKSAKGGVK